ncbi:MAG: DoxX family protein [Deltaproteobacteria bacterium]
MNATARTMLRHLTPERGFDLIRIYLGIGLTVRGVLFLLNPGWISHLLETGDTPLAARLIAVGHIAGGALLGLGLFTRIAAAIQVVPVFGALVLLHSHDDLASQNQSLEFSALVLIMLLFFACFGAGPWSLDQQRRAH